MLVMGEKISDMVRVAPDTYLCVVDRKWDKDPGPRAFIIEGPFAQSKSQNLPPPTCTPIDIEKYPADRVDPPSDLEAVTAIDGRKGHFLLVESGYFQGNFGRAIHVRLERDPKLERWRLSYVGAFELRSMPVRMPDQPPFTTDKWDQIEGAATLSLNGAILLVYTTRGDEKQAAMLHWVPLAACGETYTPQLKNEDKAKIANLGPSLGNRGAAALQLIGEPAGWRVRSVATYDPDHDFGPFRSVIYEAGLLEWDGVTPPHYTAPSEIAILWTLEGLKVEALAERCDSIDGAESVIATDDEEFGGVWRPLPASKPTCLTASMISRGEYNACALRAT